MLSARRAIEPMTGPVIGLLFSALMLAGLSACDEPESTDTTQAIGSSPAQAGEIQREASTPSVVGGQSVTLTVTPSGIGGFYAVRDDLNTLGLVDHTADNYTEGVFIMLEEEPFSYTVTVSQCPASGHEIAITGEWWIDPGQPHAMDRTTLTCR